MTDTQLLLKILHNQDEIIKSLNGGKTLPTSDKTTDDPEGNGTWDNGDVWETTLPSRSMGTDVYKKDTMKERFDRMERKKCKVDRCVSHFIDVGITDTKSFASKCSNPTLTTSTGDYVTSFDSPDDFVSKYDAFKKMGVHPRVQCSVNGTLTRRCNQWNEQVERCMRRRE